MKMMIMIEGYQRVWVEILGVVNIEGCRKHPGKIVYHVPYDSTKEKTYGISFTDPHTGFKLFGFRNKEGCLIAFDNFINTRGQGLAMALDDRFVLQKGIGNDLGLLK